MKNFVKLILATLLIGNCATFYAASAPEKKVTQKYNHISKAIAAHDAAAVNNFLHNQ